MWTAFCFVVFNTKHASISNSGNILKCLVFDVRIINQFLKWPCSYCSNQVLRKERRNHHDRRERHTRNWQQGVCATKIVKHSYFRNLDYCVFCVHVCCHVCGGQRTTLRSLFSSSTFVWVPGTNLWLTDSQGKDFSLLNCLIPKYCFLQEVLSEIVRTVSFTMPLRWHINDRGFKVTADCFTYVQATTLVLFLKLILKGSIKIAYLVDKELSVMRKGLQTFSSASVSSQCLWLFSTRRRGLRVGSHRMEREIYMCAKWPWFQIRSNDGLRKQKKWTQQSKRENRLCWEAPLSLLKPLAS